MEMDKIVEEATKLVVEKLKEETAEEQQKPSKFDWLKSLIPNAPKLKTETVKEDKWKIIYVLIGAISTVWTTFCVFSFLTSYFNPTSIFVVDMWKNIFFISIIGCLTALGIAIICKKDS